MNDLRSYRDIVEVGDTLSTEQSLEEFIISQSKESLVILIETLTKDQIKKIDDYLDEETITEAPGLGAGLSKAKKAAKDVWSQAKAGAKKGSDIATDISHGASKISGEYKGAKRVRKFGGQFLKWTRAQGIKQANAADYSNFLKTELGFADDEVGKAFALANVKPTSAEALSREKLELLTKGTGSLLDAPSRMSVDADGDVGGDEPTDMRAQAKATPGRGSPRADAGDSGRVVSDKAMLTALKDSKIDISQVRKMKESIHKKEVTWDQVSKNKKTLSLAAQIGFIYLYLS